MNPYEILGLSVHATDEEVRLRYKSLAQIHHPDKGGSEEKFKQIKLAYEILSDPIKRKEYDRTGRVEFNVDIKTEALDQLARSFYETMANAQPENQDIVLIMKNRARELRNSVLRDIETCTVQITKMQVVLIKVMRKQPNDDNIIHQFAQTQINNYKRDLETFSRRIQVCDLMVEMLEDYVYGIDLSKLIPGMTPIS